MRREPGRSVVGGDELAHFRWFAERYPGLLRIVRSPGGLPFLNCAATLGAVLARLGEEGLAIGGCGLVWLAATCGEAESDDGGCDGGEGS